MLVLECNNYIEISRRRGWGWESMGGESGVTEIRVGQQRERWGVAVLGILIPLFDNLADDSPAD